MAEVPQSTVSDDESAITDEPCEQSFPDLVLCVSLGSAYIYPSEHEACRKKCGSGAKAVNPVPSINGPCVGAGGWHYRCNKNGKYAGGSSSCCPCCEAEGKSAGQKKLCRNN